MYIVPKFVACSCTQWKNTFGLSFANQLEKMLQVCRLFRIKDKIKILLFDFLFICNLPTIYKSMSLVLLLINTFCVCADGFQSLSKFFHYRTDKPSKIYSSYDTVPSMDKSCFRLQFRQFFINFY
jgi:hypothetical protein